MGLDILPGSDAARGPAEPGRMSRVIIVTILVSFGFFYFSMILVIFQMFRPLGCPGRAPQSMMYTRHACSASAQRRSRGDPACPPRPPLGPGVSGGCPGAPGRHLRGSSRRPGCPGGPSKKVSLFKKTLHLIHQLQISKHVQQLSYLVRQHIV